MTALLWRDIESIGRLAVVMLCGVLLTVGWVIVVGLFTFSPSMAFDFPPQAFALRRLTSPRALGAAAVLAMYSYGGYNQVCNIGEEIRDPARTVPRSIVLSIFIVAALYMAMSDRHPRADSVAGSGGDADDRLGVHRAHVRGSGRRPVGRHW